MDVVRAEFTRLVSELAATQAEAAPTLETTLRTNFADGDGRLPRQLEAYLGDSGKLNRLVGDLFDEGRRDSALGRLTRAPRALLRRRRLAAGHAARPDPPRQPALPVPQRDERRVPPLNERLEALEDARKARAEERARGTAKGADFEAALEERLGAIARGWATSSSAPAPTAATR